MPRQPAENIDDVTAADNLVINHLFHDFKGGLTTVIMCLEAVRDGVGGRINEIQEGWLERAARNCDAMVSLVNDYRDMTLIEEGRLITQSEIVQLSAYVGDLQRRIAIRAQERRANIRFDIVDDLPERVMFNSSLFKRITDRLMAVILGCARTGGQIDVTVSIGSNGNSQKVLFGVVSDCIEATAEDLETVFDKQSQAMKGLLLGRGYSMLFCRTAARFMGGDLVLGISKRRGITVNLSLPFVEGAPQGG